MRTRDEITLALMAYDIGGIAFYEFEVASGKTMTAIRITDQPYSDHGVARMIADDILIPMGVECSMVASNCLYNTDNEIGIVIVTRDVEPEWARSYREGCDAAAYDEAMEYAAYDECA